MSTTDPDRPSPAEPPAKPPRPARPVPLARAKQTAATQPSPGQGSPGTSGALPAQPVNPNQPVPVAVGGDGRSAKRPAMARPVPVTPGVASRPAASAARPVPAAASPVVATTGASSMVRVRDDDEEEDEGPVAEKAIRSAPPWLVSAVVHMSILIVLGLLYLASDGDKQVYIEAVYAEDLGEQLEEDLLQMAELNMPELEIAEPVFSKDMVSVEDPFAAPPELDLSLDASTSTSDIQAPSIGIALTGREKGAKQALLAAYGGTATTEAAVQLGLAWLAKQQDVRTGLWSLTGPYSDGGQAENKLAATAMALLAFQGAGNTHKSGRYKRAVQRGADALVKLQGDDGDFFQQGGPYHHRLYSQAQATIVMCELYGMTKDEKYRRSAQKALDYATWAQSPALGGWRYIPRKESDTSVTGWFVMAYMSGKMAGLEVPSPTLDAISKYLDSATTDGAIYSYRPGETPTMTPPTMTAEGLLCRQYLGWEHDDPRMRQGIRCLLENPVDYANENPYYWYYATQVLHHVGGDDWDQWNLSMRERIPRQQVSGGAEQGSWSPTGDKRWGHHGGRLYSTCLSIYNLEVYYRHLPIYQH